MIVIYIVNSICVFTGKIQNDKLICLDYANKIKNQEKID
jgi:hypothetical protein